MRIIIVTDMEGVAGVMNFKDWCFWDSRYYEQAKVLMTEETNAAIRGFYDAAGDKIEEIMVVDGHGPGCINPVVLDERVTLSRGWERFGEFGFSGRFDLVVWVGQHAKSGTLRSHLTHTGSADMLEVRINGISVGEYGESVFRGGFYGSAVLFASGEEALCAEAKALTPHIHTVAVKHGVTLDDGRELSSEEYRNHNLGAVHLHPNEARRRIYGGAKAAMEDYLANPEKFVPCCPEPPYTLEIWYRQKGLERPYKTVQRHESDLIGMYSAPVTKYAEGEYELPY